MPSKVPPFFRAGMSSTVNFVLEEKENILVVPLRAVKKLGDKSYIFVKANGDKTQEQQIQTGLENTLNVEVVSGLKQGDEVVIPTIKMIQDLNKKFQHRRGPTNPLQKSNNN
ncbi:MAG: hypothetical protein ABIA67_05400 [Candidatus Margulisiibacteriota bacterium]